MSGDEVAIPVVFFIFSALVGIIAITTRHRERMAVIARGLSSEEIKALYFRNPYRMNPMGSLKWGIVLMFGGLAVLLGNFLHDVYHVDDSIIIGMICIFAGVALILFYGIASRKRENDPWQAPAVPPGSGNAA